MSAEREYKESEDYLNRKRTVDDFISNTEYMDRIQNMPKNEETRLIVDMAHIRNFSPEFCEQLMKHPNDYIIVFEDSIKEITATVPTDNNDTPKEIDYHVGFVGGFGSNHVSPRGLGSRLIAQLVCVEGIVTKVSLVNRKLVRSFHYCPKTNAKFYRDYRDNLATFGMPTGSAIPSEDENGNPLKMLLGFSKFLDTQSITIQELPEEAPVGQLPMSIDIIVENDLVDACKPGDRIQVCGVYRTIRPAMGSSVITGLMPVKLVANSIQALTSTPEADLQVQEYKTIKRLAKDNDIFDLLSESLAPSIYGHSFIKKAVLLQMIGGMEKTVGEGTHLRGDINIMMVGDPSTAKSQILRIVQNISSLAVTTTGRGSSGVGLTAAVTSDKDTGERRLEAGAMVLADRGVVCIDEFDKMSDADRVAIHEVMEQQTVTIAKAGIHASLNARCSVIAAANPIHGNYDRSISPQKNVALPDSLLSRFDLLFIVLDELTEEHDELVADHVVRMHRYGAGGMRDAGAMYSSKYDENGILNNVLGGMKNGKIVSEDNMDEVKTFERFDALLHGGAPQYFNPETREYENPRILSIPFLRKYVKLAKQFKPAISDDAGEEITEQYQALRARYKSDKNSNTPVTVRSLETIIRLATAHAKIRLSNFVETSDVRAVMKVMRFAMYGEAEEVRAEKGDTFIPDTVRMLPGGTRPDISDDLRQKKLTEKFAQAKLGEMDRDVAEGLVAEFKRPRLQGNSPNEEKFITFVKEYLEGCDNYLPSENIDEMFETFQDECSDIPFNSMDMERIMGYMENQNIIEMDGEAVVLNPSI